MSFLLSRRKFLSTAIATAMAPNELIFQSLGSPGVPLLDMASAPDATVMYTRMFSGASEGGYMVSESLSNHIDDWLRKNAAEGHEARLGTYQGVRFIESMGDADRVVIRMGRHQS